MGNVRMRAEQINYGASNVKAALDDLDPMSLIALSGRMDTIEAWKATVKTEEKTGADVTFTNALALDAVTLSAEIEPSQDLHGYDHPWVGGAGVNKFDISNATMTGYISDFGLTVAKDSDGYITITGTYSGTSAVPKFAIIPTLAKLDNAVFYCMDKNTDANNTIIQCRWANAETGGVAIDLQNMVQNQTYNIKFRLMIVTDGTVPTSYRPYSNICPISGRTAVTITDYDSESNTATVTVQLGQTVYGGTLNATTGVLTITHVIRDLGDLEWAKDGDNRYYYRFAADENMKTWTGDNVGTQISSIYEAISNTQYSQRYKGGINITLSSSRPSFMIYDPTYNDTAANFGTYVDGQTVCYELATPTTIQLTPEQLTMLKGYNRLSADTGDITVEAYTGAAWGGDEA